MPDSTVCNSTATLNNCVEAALDVEYMLAVSGNVHTSFYYVPNDGDFVTFITNVSSIPYPAKVYSISYGSYETDVGNAAIKTFNTEAQKLGLQGVTIIVASGDDGISGLFRLRNDTLNLYY